MNIQQMHESFRVIGQQMGMQLVRGILPESIDVYLNNVIVEKTQIDLLNNVKTVLQDNVNMQGSTMSPINLFRSLYRNARYKIGYTSEELDAEYANHEYKGEILELDRDYYPKSKDTYNSNNGYHKIWMPTTNYVKFLNNTKIDEETFILDLNKTNKEYSINPMLYLGFSVEYDDASQGNSTSCRLIGADMLETTFRDYCNGASKKEPVATMISAPIIEDAQESFSGISNEYVEIYTNTKNCRIKYITIKYIKTPNVVKWDKDLTKCVNCDLPEYTHFEIVERAVRKFFASVGIGGGEPDRRQQRD